MHAKASFRACCVYSGYRARNLSSPESYYKRKNLLKFFTKTATCELAQGPLAFAENYAQPLLENKIFEANYLH